MIWSGMPGSNGKKKKAKAEIKIIDRAHQSVCKNILRQKDNTCIEDSVGRLKWTSEYQSFLQEH